MVLDDAIEIITKMMLEDSFKNKDSSKKYVITRFELYKFCIKLLKVIKKYE